MANQTVVATATAATVVMATITAATAATTVTAPAATINSRTKAIKVTHNSSNQQIGQSQSSGQNTHCVAVDQ